MDGTGFRLQQIRVEGFKGFAGGKTLPLNGRHVFILGPNSYGKSSIVEAIRWGLFGSTRRPGEVVANQSYTGTCRVELLLERQDGEWTLKRTLIRGVSGGSDADITDRSGQPHVLREVLPRLESAPAGEGMHVVYSAQSAPLRRMPEDISAFERVILSYLGLTDARIVVGRLQEFIEERQEPTQRKLAEEVGKKRNDIEWELSRLTEQRHRIIENPPWGGGSVPAQADTTGRIQQFVKELCGISYLQSPPEVGLDLGSLVREAESLIDRASRATTSQIENAMRGTIEKLEEGQSLSRELVDLTSQISHTEGQMESTGQDLNRILSGETLAVLSKRVEELERQVEEAALLHDLRKKAYAWLESQSQEHCPVCGEEPSIGDLLGNLAKKIELASSEEKEIVAKRDTLRRQHEQALGTAKRLDELSEKSASLRKERDRVVGEIRGFLGVDFETQEISSVLQQRTSELDSAKVTLEKQLRQTSELQQEWKRRLDRIQEEVRFLRIQERLVQVQKQLRQVERVEEELKKLTLFGDSVRAISDALEAALNDTLKGALPGINQKLTEAFNVLTEHPAYNRVFVGEASLPKLELRVSSDDAPTQGWLPSQVLNGQALNALELVPYFAFSELTDMPLEVYLLLLDDPTQSFDTRHIDILIAKLAELGKRVQLIVASHEVEQFQRSLPKYFGPDDYAVVRVTAFSRQGGPAVEIANGGC